MKKRSKKTTAHFINMDCKNVSSKFSKKLSRQHGKRLNRGNLYKGLIVLSILLFICVILPKAPTTPTEASSTPIHHASKDPVEPSQRGNADIPVITISQKVIEAAVPTVACSASFTDVRWGTGIVTPPKWFTDFFIKYNVTNCAQIQWMSQIAFYETHWCHGDESQCANIIGYSQDTSLFQYIPSTWEDSWNPYRNEDIHNPESQFKATIIKYNLGGQRAWSTNQFAR